jgi:hypothetical protein
MKSVQLRRIDVEPDGRIHVLWEDGNGELYANKKDLLEDIDEVQMPIGILRRMLLASVLNRHPTSLNNEHTFVNASLDYSPETQSVSIQGTEIVTSG